MMYPLLEWMGLCSTSPMIPLAILIYLLSLLFYRYLKNGHRYWTKRNVASFSNTNIIFGNTWRLLFGLEHFTDLHKKIYEEAADKKCLGYYSFHRPMLFLKDRSLLTPDSKTKCTISWDANAVTERVTKISSFGFPK